VSGAGDFKSVYGQLMAASTLLGGLSSTQEAALRDLDGVMVTAEHVLRGTPVGAGAHSTICALLMDAYAKGQTAERERLQPELERIERDSLARIGELAAKRRP
jgi:hypothetical protein